MPTDLELQPLAPEYRYYTVDLLSNEILQEIPFSGVSWERALKSAGGFSGKIPVIPAMRHLNLYETTMPGKTALFVVRNNICVWGGIIWTREYNVIDHTLSVSASEFTSYFYHRKIWKTWNHQFGASVQIASGTGKVVFENGSNVVIFPGSSVHLEFHDPSDFKYNGYYRVETSPAPTLAGFSIVGGMSIADNASVEIIDGWAYITTKTKHGFNTGDLIEVQSTHGGPFDGVHEITVPAGPGTNLYIFPVNSSNMTRDIDFGTSSRPLPDRVFSGVTVTVRSDTYDYIRTLIDSVFTDFVGTEFPNTYIEPGISYGLNVIKKQLDGGLATITTDNDHHLAVGQAVQIQDVGPNFDGEFEVLQTPASNVFMYAAGGAMSATAVSPFKVNITSISLLNGVATMETSVPFTKPVGSNVDVFVGFNYPDLNGMQVVSGIAYNGYGFTFQSMSKNTIARTYLAPATATSSGQVGNIVSSKISGNTVTLTTREDNTFAVGGTVTVESVTRVAKITSKSLDAPNNLATFTTDGPHGFQNTVGNIPIIYNFLSNPSGRRGVQNYVALNGSIGQDAGADTYCVSNGSYGRGAVGIMLQSYMLGGSLVANSVYTLSATIYASSGSVILYAAGAGVVDPDPVSVDVASGVFTRVSVTFTTTASGDVVLYVLNGGNIVSGGIIAFQDALLEAGPTPHPYIDGSTTGIIGQSTVWTGNVDNSPSFMAWNSGVLVNGLSDTANLVKVSSTNTYATFVTEQPHNYTAGQTITINNFMDWYLPSSKSITNNVATLTLPFGHNINLGSVVAVSGLIDTYAVTSKMLSQGVATLTTSLNHNIKVNDQITISGMSDTGSVASLSAENNIAVLTLSAPHNFLEGQQITVTGVGAPFDGTFSILSATSTRVFYEIDNGNALVLPARAGGSVFTADSYFNGEFTVSAVSPTSISYVRGGENIFSQWASGTITMSSVMNGSWGIGSSTGTSISWQMVANNSAAATVPVAPSPDIVQAIVTNTDLFLGTYTISSVTRNTISVPKTLSSAIDLKQTSGVATRASIFNGSRTISATPSIDSFKTPFPGYPSNVLEEVTTNVATASAYNIFNGVYTITAVNPTERTFSYSRAWKNLPEGPVQGYGTAVVTPVAIVSSFGPYPGNADINMQYSTLGYSGTNVEPVAYRGFELKTVGEALDAYSDNLDGFEYRIDCSYDLETKSFTKTFVLVPINFPNPPAPGEIAPLSRYGADKLVFEYPGGSIMSMTVAESAEGSATRFFAVGEGELGPDVGPNISIASNEDLLSGNNGDDNFRRWPLLDETEKIDGVDDETVLYAYAERYLSENRPPDAKLNIVVNGSIAPIVGSYAPGDWCALIVKDDFILMRLKSDLEPRDDVIVRKVDGYKVEVPDGTTFPEKVTLTLVPEWEVDQIGKPSI
jgi:hypothetical protein